MSDWKEIQGVAFESECTEQMIVKESSKPNRNDACLVWLLTDQSKVKNLHWRYKGGSIYMIKAVKTTGKINFVPFIHIKDEKKFIFMWFTQQKQHYKKLS